MTAVREVSIQVEAPTEDSPRRISLGYYVVHDNVLTMTNPDGEIITVGGNTYEYELGPDDNPAAIARRFTRRIWEKDQSPAHRARHRARESPSIS